VLDTIFKAADTTSLGTLLVLLPISYTNDLKLLKGLSKIAAVTPSCEDK
jgi:hypothetical protein